MFWTHTAKGARICWEMKQRAEWDAVKVDEQGLKQEIDSLKPFEKDDRGWLESEAMLKFKRTAGKFAFTAFIECRQKMQPMRIGFLRMGREEKYREVVLQAAGKYESLKLSATKIAG